MLGNLHALKQSVAVSLASYNIMCLETKRRTYIYPPSVLESVGSDNNLEVSVDKPLHRQGIVYVIL